MRIFQSTLPREERPIICRIYNIRIGISIHAPTRGATKNMQLIGMKLIFQSTLPREERLIFLLENLTNYIFQSTLPREERQLPLKALKLSIIISIHAPTRGATQKIEHIELVQKISIHAPTRGATYFLWEFIQKCIFQSTLPREERLHMNPYNNYNMDFNPRSHERSDHCKHSISKGVRYFNPRSHERSDA